ncbi:MAG: glutathione peroxidase [Gammaproteobacteria bacterium]|nr:glutathione peroxidase [Gammaproteobacteria bacterium]
MTPFYDIQIDGLDNQAFDLSQFKDKVVLIVNVASECGLTPQYAGLQSLFDKYKDKGFMVLGVPCNQFGQQEPGSNEAIAQFCTTKFNVTFPMTTKIDVNGDNRHPLYQFLIEDGDDIEWNFAKFLVNKNGYVAQRFSARLDPLSDEVIHEIEHLL